MIILGIDPGLSGALVALDGDFGYLGHLCMPTMKHGSKNRVNGAAVKRWLRVFSDSAPISQVHAYLEEVNAMPSRGKDGGQRTMGAASAFSFGHGAGMLEGLLLALEIPYTPVAPATWKARAGLRGQEKDAARSRCIQLYPGLEVLDLKGKGQAVADALLIARYGGEKKPG